MSKNVKDFIEILPFKTYVDFSDLDMPEDKEKLAREYVITKEVHKHLKLFLKKVFEIRKSGEKTLLVLGSYGTGKSYFLAFSCLILESLLDERLFGIVHSKLGKEKDIWRQVSQLKNKGLRFLPVKINMKTEPDTESICGILIKNLKRAVREYLKKDIKLDYEWDEWLAIIQNRMKSEDQNRLVKILEKKGYSLNDIIDQLEERDYEAIEILMEAFNEEFGFAPQPAPLDIKTIYEQTCRTLKKDCDGIVFLIDELQKYLESSKKVDSDLTHLEALCEGTEGKPIIIIPSVLEVELARKYGWGKTYDKFVSRFDQLLLTLEGLEDIVGSRLKFTGELRERLKKEDSAKVLTNDNLRLLFRLYPLNPVTFRLLKKIAQIRAADRSAFTFLLNVYNRIGTMPFVGVNGKLTLINPDTLFDYFSEDLDAISTEVVSEVNTFLGLMKDEGKPHVKYMGIATIMEDQFTRSDLSQAFLDKSEYTQKLMMEIIGSRPRSFETIKENEIYSIRPITGAVRDTIEEFKMEVRKPFENLVEDLNSSNLSVTSQKVQGVERKIRVEFCLLKDAEKHLKMSFNEEVRLLVLLPETEIHLNDPQIRKLLSMAGDWDVILFVMKQRIPNLENLREYFAVKQAVKQQRLLEADVKSIISNTELLFTKLFASDNFSVWYKGKRIRKQDLILVESGLRINNNLLEKILYEVFKSLYPKYFELWTKFKGEDVDFTTRRWTNVIVRSFLSKGTISRPPSAITQIRNLVQPIGLAEERKGEFYVNLPKEGEVGIQRKIIDDIFDQINKEHDFNELYDLLVKPPYGFPDPLIEIYLVALLANKKILIKDKVDQLVKINLENPAEIRSLIEDSKKGTQYYVFLTRIFPDEKWVLIKELLSGIVEGPTDELKDVLKQKSITEDRIFELKEVLEEKSGYYKGKLRDMEGFLKKYGIEISRMQRKFKLEGGSK